MPTTDPIVIVITDANVLINFHHIQQLPLLGSLPPYRFNVPQEVINEIIDLEQRTAVDDAITAGFLQPFVIDELDALALFAHLRDLMGRGEAACLAAAATQGYHIASDEKKRFRRTTIELIGESRLLRTEDLILHSIRLHKVTIEEADVFKKILAQRRYAMPFLSFAERL